MPTNFEISDHDTMHVATRAVSPWQRFWTFLGNPWFYVLRHVPLSIAFPLSNVVHVLVPLSCWIFLHELISTRRWCGIALVLIGLAVVAKPFSRIEEKL